MKGQLSIKDIVNKLNNLKNLDNYDPMTKVMGSFFCHVI